jgi:hypothetical protein
VEERHEPENETQPAPAPAVGRHPGTFLALVMGSQPIIAYLIDLFARRSPFEPADASQELCGECPLETNLHYSS